MELNLQALGFTQGELQQRVVDQVVERVLTGIYFDEDGDEVERSSKFSQAIQAKVKVKIDETITALAEKYLLPNVSSYIENMLLQQTNQWGEKKGTSVTFVEYLIGRAEIYITEKVDSNGNDKAASNSSYWNGNQTRITYLVEKHLHHSIETAMKESMKTALGSIAIGLHETCRLKLNEIAAAMKVAVTTK